MVQNPGHWQKYYRGDAEELRLARRFSLSDRSRYYWSEPRVEAALGRLFRNLSGNPPPPALAGQHAPTPYGSMPLSRIPVDPRQVILRKLFEVTTTYARACGVGAAAGGVA
jgi:D-tagatose-1,6-bisphosphate aldolase subunit GatZ/KbaZ